MKTQTKLIITAVTTIAGGFILKLLTPAAQLAANSVIVGQMEHSDSASLMNSVVGNGESWATIPMAIIYFGILIFVWTRKTTETKNETKDGE